MLKEPSTDKNHSQFFFFQWQHYFSTVYFKHAIWSRNLPQNLLLFKNNGIIIFLSLLIFSLQKILNLTVNINFALLLWYTTRLSYFFLFLIICCGPLNIANVFALRDIKRLSMPGLNILNEWNGHISNK